MYGDPASIQTLLQLALGGESTSQGFLKFRGLGTVWGSGFGEKVGLQVLAFSVKGVPGLLWIDQ